MTIDDKTALIDLTDRWLNQFSYAPHSDDLHGFPSPCIIKTENLTVYWKPVLMQPAKQLTGVEDVLGLRLCSSAHIFYGTQYADNIEVIFENLPLTLIQVWSDDDFIRLEKNLIEHLLMQRKLRRTPTIFIGSTRESSVIIALNNVSGEVINENLITGEHTVLAPTLENFLQKLSIS